MNFHSDNGGSTFLRNVSSTRATLRHIPEDNILQGYNDLHQRSVSVQYIRLAVQTLVN
jgi:hypothetical protein